MAIISSAEQTSGDFTSPSLLAGDVVVVALATLERQVVDFITGQGWAVLGGSRWNEQGYDFHVLWKRAPSAGVLTGQFFTEPLDNTAWVGSVVVRGYNAVSAWEVSRQNAQVFTYPGVYLDSTPQNGDVVHCAIYDPHRAGSFQPTGSTLRQSGPVDAREGISALVATGSFSGVTELSAASATGFGGGWAVTVAVSSVAGPAAPTILAPAEGSMDLAAGFDVSWSPSGVQTGYAIRAAKGGGAWAWWDGAGFNATSETVIDGTDTTVTVPAGELTNAGDEWVVEVATKGDMNRPELGAYGSVGVTGWGSPTAPTVTVTDVTDGVLDSFTPTISLSGSVASGASGPQYHVQILDSSGGVLVDTGILAGGSYTISVEQGAILSRHNREGITVVGRTVQNGTQYSDATLLPLTLRVVTPDAPTVTLSAYDHPTSGLPGTLVAVTPSTAMSSGLLEVARVTDAARETIWSGDIAAGWEVVDYLAPTGRAVHYEARVTTGDAIPLTSPWGTSALTRLDDGGWIVDPLDPSTAVFVHYQEFGAREHGTRAAAYQPLGSSKWLVHTGGRVDPAATATVRTIDPASAERAVALLSSGRALMARMWPERDGGEVHGVDDLHVRVTGDVSESRIIQGDVSWRAIAFPYVTVDAPTWGP